MFIVISKQPDCVFLCNHLHKFSLSLLPLIIFNNHVIRNRNILALLTAILACIIVRNIFPVIILSAEFLTFWTFNKIHFYTFSITHLFFTHFYGSLFRNLEISLYGRWKDYITSVTHIPKVRILCFYNTLLFCF